MKAEEVADKLGEPYRHGFGYVRIPCYNSTFHKNDDKDPSLVIYDGDRGYYCFACGVNGSHEWLFKQFGIAADLPRRKRIEYKKEYKQYDFQDIYTKLKPLTEAARKVMADKGLDPDMLEEMGWRWHSGVVKNWGDGIFIPYKVKGRVVGARLRMLNGNIRFMSLPGGESFAFMTDDMKDDCFVCEGETDTLTLHQLGYKAAGIPGATNTQSIKKLIYEAQKSGTRLTVVPDNDEAGRNFYERVKRVGDEYNVEVKMLQVPVAKDVNEWYNLVGKERFTNYLKENKYEQNGSVPEDTSRRGQTDFRLV